MSEPDHEIRRALERLSDPTDGSRPLTLDRLAARRRRRIRNAVLTMVPLVVVGVVGGLMVSGHEDDTTVTAEGGQDGSTPPSARETVSVERTQVVGGDGGTARVVMEFDGPLPGRDLRYVDDIASLDAADQIVYTTQEAGGVHVCDSVHSFPPPAEGTVDLLIPAAWFADGAGSRTGPLETIDDPAKFVVCGPHNGFYQYAIWGPVSSDVADVDVTIDPDGTRLTVQIGGSGPEPTATAPPDIDPDDGEVAKAVVSAFLDDLRRDDLDAAAERWTAYPDLGPDAPPADKKAAIEALVADPTFSRILHGDTDTFVTASWGWSTAVPVVTVLASRDGEDPPTAVAFLTGSSGDGPGAEGMSILRLPSTDAASEPDAAGSFAEPGHRIVVPGAPLEGGARAYIDGREVPVDVDHASLTMTITLPADITGDVAITVSAATPELPTAHAFALTIGSA